MHRSQARNFTLAAAFVVVMLFLQGHGVSATYAVKIYKSYGNDSIRIVESDPYRLAKDIHVPLRRINEIVLGRRGVSADTALRLARYFKTTPQFWLNLQSHYELDTVRLALQKTIELTIQPSAALAEVA